MTKEELTKAIREDYERKGVWAIKTTTLTMKLDFEMLGIILEALEEPKWIPVSERLPKEKDGSVLITMPDKKVTTARYSEFSDKWYVGDMMGVGGPDPLAWMPLPTSYTPQKNEVKE